MSEGGGEEEEPKRLSQIFEPLVDFQAKASLYGRSSSSTSSTTSSGGTPSSKLNRDYAIPASSKLLPAVSRSTPNSPRLLAKRHQQRPAVPKKPTAAFIANPNLQMMFDTSGGVAAWTPFSGLTENLDVRQVNNYQEDFPEINWQERCLELQLELHRSRNQVGKVRDMMKEKLQELERRVVEAEQRAEDAQKQVRVMEQKFCDWPTYENCPSRADTDSEKTISQLEHQVEEQKQLRLQDAKQVEAKAAKIKEWVTNKLRDLEEQNQVLREQNIKCNQQLDILKNHIASQSNRSSLQQQQIRASLSLEVQESQERRSRQRSDSLDSPGSRSLAPDLQKYYDQKKNMEPQELARDLACAVEDLSVSPTVGRRSPMSDVDTAHDYAEIYTPSVEKTPAWLKGAASGRSSTTTSESTHEFRPPTPPLHRFPSWEAKIYQLAKEGISGTDNDMQETESMAESTTTKPERTRSQVTSVGYCDINVPVYATVKGRASQIRSVPFSGDSSDSSDAEENAVILTYNATSTHNSSSTENTESSASASSPSKHATSKSSTTHQSPAKKIGSESPKARQKERTALLAEDSALSDDYAIPPDAMSVVEHSLIDTLPSLLMRSSYVDSPNKKIDTLEKSGHLHRLGGKLKTWRKRYFQLKNGNLTYWKSQHDVNRKPQGHIFLDDICRITHADGASTFEIDTGKKVYYLAAESNTSVDDWVRTLQNVQRRNAAKLLLSRDDQKATVQGWVTKVKNGHGKRCWCVLMGKMFMYFKGPGEASPIGQINMRDARVEEVEHVSDSDSEEREESQNQAKLTVSIYPQHQGPTYLILPNKQERDNWLYHLTVVSGGSRNSGTQYEQLIQKLMEMDGDATSVIWRHPVLLHTKDQLNSPLTSLENETLQAEAIKLFKSCQLFMSVAVNQPAIDYHVVLAQNALQLCLDTPKIQSELICGLIKQTSPHLSQKLSAGVQVKTKRQLLLCATQSLFTCDSQPGITTQANGLSPSSNQQTSIIPPIDCKSNPPPYTFIQGWQLLALAVSLFVPKNNRLLWYLKLHLSRHSDSKTESGKYAIYCERALERTMQNGDREAKPSRMEVLSILLKNPYHHSLPHAIPVHFLNGTYQVVSFDGSTTIEEFQATLSQEIGCRDSNNGFAMFSDDPIERDLEHFLDPQAKVCDVISKWETALREKGSGKFENSRVIQLTYKNRLYWKGSTKLETDKERLLLVYQANHQIVQGRFPLSKELALELASLMAQIDLGDFTVEKLKNASLQALDKFYPYRYRDAMSPEALKELQESLSTKWALLKGKSVVDCVRIYLTCARKWPFFGAVLFQAQPRHSDQAMVWLAVSEDALSVLELSSMASIARYTYANIMTFGGCQDDFMVVVGSDDVPDMEQKLLFALSKPKILELTLLIADFMNALGHTVPGTPKTNTLTRNNSHRSVRSRMQHTVGSGGTLPNDTLNSQTTYTLNSHSHTFNSQNSMPMNVQPDILKSLNTPDHHKTKK